MITLFRMIRLWQLRTKWRLAFWQEFNKQATTLMKNPEEIEKKIIPFLAELIHNSVTAEKERMATGEFGVK